MRTYLGKWKDFILSIHGVASIAFKLLVKGGVVEFRRIYVLILQGVIWYSFSVENMHMEICPGKWLR